MRRICKSTVDSTAAAAVAMCMCAPNSYISVLGVPINQNFLFSPIHIYLSNNLLCKTVYCLKGIKKLIALYYYIICMDMPLFMSQTLSSSNNQLISSHSKEPCSKKTLRYWVLVIGNFAFSPILSSCLLPLQTMMCDVYINYFP